MQYLHDVIVSHFDLATICGHDAEGREVSVAIPEKYSGITRLLKEGDTINVVDDMIIYQPDYLVDITTIATCFESYADTPYISLLHKLKTVPPTKAIHLGNLVSQFLDEEVHGQRVDYADSIKKFFHENALDMAVAFSTMERGAFHREAQQQRENIHNLLSAFDTSEVLLEPSFFCEMLGLQGRMDYLQSDYSVLIEQKSGKGGFLRSSGCSGEQTRSPQKDADTPIYLEKHYVQMLLYRAMLKYGYKGGDAIESYLLYSKYKNGLVKLDSDPELLHRAVMLRNQIAYLEMSYAAGGAEVLLTMKPEQLRRKPISDRFWQTWVKPEIERVLLPIQTASQLEQAYFLRMLRFVAKEHEMSKMVRQNEKEENTGFAAKWHTSLEDKLASGSIIHQLHIEEFIEEEGTITKVRLSLPDSHLVPLTSHNFRPGDIVTLYAYKENTEPDIRKAIVHRGTIEEISSEIIIRLRSPQTDSKAFADSHYAIEHDFYESSTTSLFRSLHRFLSAPAHRKALILSQRKPEFDTTREIKGDYGQFNDLVLGAVQAKDLYLVMGPPGTGKTSFGLLNILREQLLQGGSVLLMAYTNRAVDEICSKLVEESLDFIRIGSPLSCEKAYRDYLLEEKTKSCNNVGEIQQLIADTRIFVGTTTAVTSSSISLFALKNFELAIIDEASQILEPQLLGLLSASDGIKVSIEKIVLIGDHKQLPAVVQQTEEDSRVTEQCLIDIGLTDCRNSFFERMYNNLVPYFFLSHQGRMHEDIADFPNHAFYGGKLDIAGLPHQQELIDEPRVKFIPVTDTEQSSSDKINITEARIIAQEVEKVIEEYGKNFDPLQTVGVIVPYRSQIAAVRNALREEYRSITIDTVERYQGSQRDVIIYGFTVKYPYQLKFLTSATYEDPITGDIIDRRLNVALTRARKKEIIVGNPQIISQAPVFRSLIEYCASHA